MPIKLTISQQPNGVLFSGSGTLNIFSFPPNIPGGGTNFGSGNFFYGPTKIMGAAVGNINAKIGLLTGLLNVNTIPTANYGLYNIINLTSTNNHYFSFGQNFGDTPWQNVLAYSTSNANLSQPFNFSYLIPNQTYTSLGLVIQNNTYTWTNTQLGISDSLQVEVLTPVIANVVITIQQVLNTVNVSAVGTINPNGLVPIGVYTNMANNIISHTILFKHIKSYFCKYTTITTTILCN